MVHNFRHGLKCLTDLHPFVRLFAVFILLIMIGLSFNGQISSMMISSGLIVIAVYITIFAVWLNYKIEATNAVL